MSRHRYATRSLVTDYARSGVGMAFTFAPLGLLETGPIGAGVFAGLGALFLAFAIRTWRRQRLEIELSDEGIGARRKRVRWDSLERLTLRFYPTKRDRSDGWMQMNIKGGGRGLRIDSHLEGFGEIAERAAEAAQANAVGLSHATEANLASLGIRLRPGLGPPIPSGHPGERPID
ncbi:MAG: hypothetical protein O7A65_03640 [Proteobacteria bacterium]|nr:hypothetical protein [Pseudomonadota bacterium]